MWDMLASERIPMVAYHFPLPGVGFVGKLGDGVSLLPDADEDRAVTHLR